MKAFETWVFDGTRYLAVPTSEGVYITDERGWWYGGWQSIANFRKRQREQGEWQALPGVRARVSLRTEDLE